jgi:lambda family phage portal protein
MALTYRLINAGMRALGAQPESSRTYAAAQSSRLTSDWNVHNASANTEIKMSLRVMRARSRQLARDDDYFKGYLTKLVNNVIGTNGVTLQCDAKTDEGEKLTKINRAVERAFSEWAKKDTASVTGQESWRDVQSLALKTLCVDGETVIRLILDRANPFKIAVQFLDADWLDEDFNSPDYNGNRIIMSVEVDKYDKPVAYWFTEPRWNRIALPGQVIQGMPRDTDRIRIPANQIIHLFIKDRPGQTRGMVWAHAAMMRLNMLNGYEEAELVGQRVAASYMAFVAPQADATGLAPQGYTGDIPQEVSPGIVAELPAGFDLKMFDPKRPGTTYSVFVKSILRAIAVSLGISYNSFANDLESTSYSSGRIGSIEDRDNWRGLQKWLMEHLCQPVFEKWLAINLGSERLEVPASSLKQLKNPVWRGRGFDWVDPSKDAMADIELNAAGMKTLTEIYGDRGLDFEEQMEIFAHEKKLMEKLDLQFGANLENVQTLKQQDNQAENSIKVEKSKPKPTAKPAPSGATRQDNGESGNE